MSSLLVLGVAGSAARSRRTRALVSVALEGAAADGADTELIDLSEVTLEFADGRPFDDYSGPTRDVLERVRAADAYVFGSPMYRASMTGVLKNLLDLIPSPFITGKACGLVATGGNERHYLGLELGMRSAMAFFGVHVVPAIVYGSDFELAGDRPSDEGLVEEARSLGRAVVRLASAVRERVEI